MNCRTSTLSIMLIKDGVIFGKKAEEMIKAAGFTVDVSLDAYNVTAVLDYLKRKKTDAIILVRSEDKRKNISSCNMSRITDFSKFVQKIVFAEKDDKEASKIALEWDAAWVITFDDSIELVKMVLERVARKQAVFLNEYEKKRQLLFSNYLKDEEQLPNVKTELFMDYADEKYFQIVKIRVLPPYSTKQRLNENSSAANKGYQLLLSRLEKLKKYFITRDGPDIIICLFGDDNELSLGKQQMRKFLIDMAEFSQATSLFYTWICMGNIVNSAQEIKKSLTIASDLMIQRFFKSGSDMFEESQMFGNASDKDQEGFQFFDVKKSLIYSLQNFDQQGICTTLARLKNNILSYSNFDGNNLYLLYKTLVSTFFETMGSQEADLSVLSINYDSMLLEYKYFRTIDDAFDSVKMMYLDGVDLLKEKEENNFPVAIVLAKRYIRAYFNMPLDLNEISDYVGMDESYFSHYFSKHVNMTFKQYQTNLRIGYSKRLLFDKAHTLEEISDEVGYSSVKYFFRVFKRETGVSPGEYRIRHNVICDHRFNNNDHALECDE